MEFKEQEFYPGQWENNNFDYLNRSGGRGPKKKGVSVAFLISAVCLVAAIAILLTFVINETANRRFYSAQLAQQQAVIDHLKEQLKDQESQPKPGDSEAPFDQLELLAQIYDYYSYYAGDVSEEELLTAVMKAYAMATGDDYAEYYTEEEFEALTQDRTGDHVGIGISVVQETLDVNGSNYAVFQVIAIYKHAPASQSKLRVGDYIYGVKTADGAYKSVGELGYTNAVTAIQGEKGTQAEILVFRAVGENFESLPIAIVRNDYETESVSYRFAAHDPTIAIVHISQFDLTTPVQFKAAMQEAIKGGAEHFVLDVRNNPGGDLQSIKAVMTYFLEPGDLILSSIDRDGTVVKSYEAEPMRYTDEYASCNVSLEEIGMYRELDMVVLCNQNTASAAEVFTATLRDYELARIVGVTTFGKGIMQSYIPLSAFGDYTGYAKMTTYAYVTKCGVTYHQIGIVPHVEVELSPEALEYNFYLLPEAIDNQLQAAFAQFQ